MKSRSAVFALVAMLSIPGMALAQPAPPRSVPPVTTTPRADTATVPPATTTTTTSPAPARGAANYTTADDMTRASKIIGASVYNDQNENVGSVDELLIDNNHGVKDVVLSVGGFLGIGSKLVKVPYSDIEVQGDKLVMSGASKDQLKQMPDYKFNPTKAS